MVIRTRAQRLIQACLLYLGAAAFIAYFGFHAYHGDHGLRAKQQYAAEIAELSSELQTLRGERAGLERRVALLQPQSIDPDLLDQRARELLNFADPRDLVFVQPRR